MSEDARRRRRRSRRNAANPKVVTGLGGELIAKVLQTGNAAAFKAVRREDMANDDERALYDLVRGHLDKYGELPSPKALRREGISIPRAEDLKDSIGYHRDQVVRRATYNTIRDHHEDLMDAVRANDMDAAVDVVDRMQADIDAVRTRDVADDPEAAARVLEQMGGCSLAELQDREFEPRVDVVHEVVGPGLTLLAGDPKCGKSWLVMDLSLSVAAGADALGSLPVARGPVLHLALEDTPQAFRDRVEAMEAEFNPDVTVCYQCRRLDGGGLSDIEQLVAHHRPCMVVIDTFNAVRQEADDRKPIQQREYRDLRGLKEMADRYGTAVVVVVHTRKGRGSDPIEKTAGSHGFTAGADNVVMLARDGDAATLVTRGRHLADREFRLARQPDTMRWRVQGRSAAVEVGETDLRVYYHVLDAGRPVRPREVAEALDFNASTVRASLARLLKRDFLLDYGSTRDRTYTAMDEQLVFRVSDFHWEEWRRQHPRGMRS